MNTRKITVIVPNYNHAQFLRQRVNSILAQTYQDFELILLDDCSTDSSRSILREYSCDRRVRLEFSERNSGSPFRQWDKGVHLAQGDYIWIAESDDYADQRFLERLVGVLDGDPAIVLAYCRSWLVDEDGDQQGLEGSPWGQSDPHRWDADYCVEGQSEARTCFLHNNPVANASAAVFRKAAYDAVGGVDDTLRTSGDWKLWAAMALTGRVAYVSEPLNYYRFHRATVRTRSNKALIVAEQLEVVRWILDRVVPTRADLQKLYADASYRWVPAAMSLRVPADLRLRVLRGAIAIDPHPFRRLLMPIVATIRLKILRHWREVRSTVTVNVRKYANR